MLEAVTIALGIGLIVSLAVNIYLLSTKSSLSAERERLRAEALDELTHVQQEQRAPPPAPPKDATPQEIVDFLKGARKSLAIALALMLPATALASEPGVSWRPDAVLCTTIEGEQRVCLTLDDAYKVAVQLKRYETSSTAVDLAVTELSRPPEESVPLWVWPVSIAGLVGLGALIGVVVE